MLFSLLFCVFFFFYSYFPRLTSSCRSLLLVVFGNNKRIPLTPFCFLPLSPSICLFVSFTHTLSLALFFFSPFYFFTHRPPTRTLKHTHLYIHTHSHIHMTTHDVHRAMEENLFNTFHHRHNPLQSSSILGPRSTGNAYPSAMSASDLITMSSRHQRSNRPNSDMYRAAHHGFRGHTTEGKSGEIKENGGCCCCCMLED